MGRFQLQTPDRSKSSTSWRTPPANPTIKLKFYRRGEGGFYSQSNIPPTVCEPCPHGQCAYLAEPHRMAFSLVRVELAQRKCVAEHDWTQDLSSGTKLEDPLLSIRLRPTFYRRGDEVFYSQSTPPNTSAPAAHGAVKTQLSNDFKSSDYTLIRRNDCHLVVRVRGMEWIAVQWMNVLLHMGYII
jgi:hypothetical protein